MVKRLKNFGGWDVVISPDRKVVLFAKVGKEFLKIPMNPNDAVKVGQALTSTAKLAIKLGQADERQEYEGEE